MRSAPKAVRAAGLWLDAPGVPAAAGRGWAGAAAAVARTRVVLAQQRRRRLPGLCGRSSGGGRGCATYLRIYEDRVLRRRLRREAPCMWGSAGQCAGSAVQQQRAWVGEAAGCRLFRRPTPSSCLAISRAPGPPTLPLSHPCLHCSLPLSTRPTHTLARLHTRPPPSRSPPPAPRQPSSPPRPALFPSPTPSTAAADHDPHQGRDGAGGQVCGGAGGRDEQDGGHGGQRFGGRAGPHPLRRQVGGAWGWGWGWCLGWGGWLAGRSLLTRRWQVGGAWMGVDGGVLSGVW